jgi:hypothetical protein
LALVVDLCDENLFKKFIIMKKLTLCMMITFMALSIIPSPLSAANETKVKSESPTVAAASDLSITTAQLARLEEIKAMDMSTLSRSEKKVLRTEVKAIKSDQDERRRRYNNGPYGNDNNGRHNGGVVIVSAGGGLLIILLIILLL